MKSFLFRTILKRALCVAMAFVCLVSFAGCGKDKGLIAEGVSVSSVNIGGMTKAEAKDALAKSIKYDEDMVLVFESEGVTFNVDASQLEIKSDIQESLNRAYAVGRGADKKQNKKDIKKAKKEGISINAAISFDKDKLILAASDNLGDKITDPSPMNVEFGEDCLIVTNALEGKIVDTDEAKASLEKELSDFDADLPIKLSLVSYTPDNLTFEEFKKKYVKEAQDAVYTSENGEHHIEPEVMGVQIDEDEAKRIFEENKNSKEAYKIPAKITKPDITASYLEDKYVNKIMSKYSTSFAGSSAGRCANIALAAAKIDGYVVNPGARFSYNKVVGPRTEAAGFKMAHVYVGTKVVDGIGGGICQVSSALYNAVVLADLKTVSRTNHSIPVNYVPLGRDATVSYGSIDYVFENNKPYPVSIKAKIEGTTLTVSVVGTSEMDYTVEFQTRYVSSIPFGTTEVEDENLPEGEKKVVTGGSNGSVYESFRVYKKNGVEYDRKFEAKSRYQPVAQEVAVGAKKADEPSEELEEDDNTNTSDTENSDKTEPPAQVEEETQNAEQNQDKPIQETEPVDSNEYGDINDIIVHPETEESPSEQVE